MKAKEITLSAIDKIEDITFGHIIMMEQVLRAIHKAPKDSLPLQNAATLLGITEVGDSITFNMTDEAEVLDRWDVCSKHECHTCPDQEACYAETKEYTQVYKLTESEV